MDKTIKICDLCEQEINKNEILHIGEFFLGETKLFTYLEVCPRCLFSGRLQHELIKTQELKKLHEKYLKRERELYEKSKEK